MCNGSNKLIREGRTLKQIQLVEMRYKKMKDGRVIETEAIDGDTIELSKSIENAIQSLYIWRKCL